MALIDDMEFFGRAVAAGELPRERAIELLCDVGKGITASSAAYSIDNWMSIRSEYNALFDRTQEALCFVIMEQANQTGR